MKRQYRIADITDTMQLSEDQFGHFLVDFVAWWALCKAAQSEGAEVVGFTWVDDDKPGQVHNIEITDPKTGEKRTWEGPAFSALAPQKD